MTSSTPWSRPRTPPSDQLRYELGRSSAGLMFSGSVVRRLDHHPAARPRRHPDATRKTSASTENLEAHRSPCRRVSQDIFTMYVNQIYYGAVGGCRGGRQHVFQQACVRGDTGRIRALAGLPQAPSITIRPRLRFQQAKIRQRYVLAMRESAISRRNRWRRMSKEPLQTVRAANQRPAPRRTLPCTSTSTAVNTARTLSMPGSRCIPRST